jgi:hypothetical protein
MDDTTHTILGRYGIDRHLRLDSAGRARHVYAVGATGTGKSTLLRNLVQQDIAAGRGVCFIDPHGDEAEALLSAIPRRRCRQVCYLSPADTDYPLAFNLFDHVPPDQRALAAKGVVAAFRHLWDDSWGPQLNRILFGATLTLFENPGTTMLDLPRVFMDGRHRERLARRASDPTVKIFWQREFPLYQERTRGTAAASVLNKVQEFLAMPALRNVLGQSPGRLHLDHLLARGRILIVNLSKGQIGEEAANLLGSLIITGVELATLARAGVPKSKRRPFVLAVDELQNFSTSSMAGLLSESRKYNLHLVLANQYTAGLTPRVRDAILGNVGTLMVFRVGAEDADLFARQFAPLKAQEIKDLPAFNAWCRPAHSVNHGRVDTLPPAEPQGAASVGLIKRQSRRAFARERASVESKIARFYRDWSASASSAKKHY